VPVKSVLIIAFIYPPLGGSGVQRTLKFSKYLPEFGCQPYIVCSDDPDIFQHGLDASLLAEIPSEARVWRRPFVSPLGFRRRVQKLLRLEPRNEIAPLRLSQSALAMSKSERAEKGSRRWFQALTRPLAPFEFPPVDAALYWALAIVPGCLRLIRREKIDVILTTSFPYSDHIAGYLLKKLSGKPWVADFRDPWTQNASARNCGWRYQVDQWIEQRVLRTADRVIGVTPSYTTDLRRLAPRRSGEHFLTIENGYDLADFNRSEASLRGAQRPSDPEFAQAEIAPLRLAQSAFAMTGETLAGSRRNPEQPVRLAHVGYLYDGTALPFFQALEALGPLGRRLQVRFIGGLAPQETRWLENHPLPAQVLVETRRPHFEAVQAMRAADVLLLFVLAGFPNSGHYPGKIFEYLASGNPILLVGSDGDAAELVRRSGTGRFVPADNLQAIVATLGQLSKDYADFKREVYQPRPEVVTSFERKALTGKLVAALNEIDC
jgi:glycosyltransferase involved in cell wall biosynthesis